MVDDKLISKDELSFSEYAVAPAPEHVQLNSHALARRQENFRSKLSKNPTTVILTHDDADGLTSAALVESQHEAEETAIETVVHNGPFGLSEALEVLYEHPCNPLKLYLLDFCFEDDTKAIEMLREKRANLDVEAYDHHQWDNPEVFDDVHKMDLTVDTDYCTSTLLLKVFGPDLSDDLWELAKVTEDWDLWIREDERSPKFQTFAREIVDEPEEYVYTVLEHGVDLPEDVEEAIEEHHREEEQLRKFAIDDVSYDMIGDYRVAITYLGKGSSADIGNELVEDHEYDIAVIQKAHGGAGIYSHSDEDVGFNHCHRVAQKLNGGGHPTASGFGHEFENFRQLAEYWASCGQSERWQVVRAIKEVVTELDEEGEE